ncbi:MAG: 23S rRNA (guanosine(2251)-2'-O)-methyltransferase RlmB [Firmicutes bacterium]|nr:23S rRNA (guanosine(2251)-2'-O)-methyltransferase RlmB [Bacillota bacterium]
MRKKKEKKSRFDLIWGRHPVLESLKGGLPVQKIDIFAGARGWVVEEIVKLAQKGNIPVKRVPLEELEKRVSGENHQGIIAYLSPYCYLTTEELLQQARSKGLPFLLMLDHLQDPFNFGSLLRTASLTNASGAIIPQDRACGVTPAVFKGSAGALAHVPVARTVNLAREVDFLKGEGLWVMGADMEGELPFFEADFRLPMVLILGSEGKGLSRLLKEKCDFLLRIPTAETISSLNVSVAGGIVMYEVFRQRGLRV